MGQRNDSKQQMAIKKKEIMKWNRNNIQMSLSE